MQNSTLYKAKDVKSFLYEKNKRQKVYFIQKNELKKINAHVTKTVSRIIEIVHNK